MCSASKSRSLDEDCTLPRSVAPSDESMIDLICNAQELDLQCRQIRTQLCNCTQSRPLRALVLQSLLQHYLVNKDHLLCYINCVLVPVQESL